MCEKLLAIPLSKITGLKFHEFSCRGSCIPRVNCDRDMAVALRRAGADVHMVWHKDTELPAGLDLVALPGGFSFGDYLRCGAIAARAPIMRAVSAFSDSGATFWVSATAFKSCSSQDCSRAC